MKTTVLTLLVLLLTSSINSQSNNFLLGFSSTYPNGHTYDVSQYADWGWYNELSMNTWQGFYLGDNHPEVVDKLHSYNLNGLFDIDTVRWAAYGRIDIHEAESTHTDRFCYDNHFCGTDYQDFTQFGYGQWVRYYNANSVCNPQNPGTVLWNVHENGMQSFGNWDPMKETWFNGNEVQNTWYIKPRVRINVVDTLTDEPVFKLIVKAYNGDTILTRIVSTSNFRDTNYQYHGEYLENYWGLDLSFGSDTISGINEGNFKGDHYNFPKLLSGACHVDYQIYWYGTVSMYIDYVKIMNRPAQLFFGNTTESERIRQRIKEKIQILIDRDGSNNKMKGFYTEEIEYGILRCLKGVNDYLADEFDNSDKVKIYSLINWWSYTLNLKTKLNRDADYKMYLDSIHPPSVMVVNYLFNGPFALPDHYKAQLPENVSFQDPGPVYYPLSVSAYESGIINAQKIPLPAYNNYLQRLLDDYADTMYYFYSMGKNTGVNLISVPQLCQWKTHPTIQSNREPLNSEFGATVGISLCRGTKGIFPFLYESSYDPTSNYFPALVNGRNIYGDNPDNPSPNFYVGMTDFDDANHWGYTKRLYNFYGEPKWDYVSGLYAKIKNQWGQIAFASTNTTGFSVVKDGVSHEYISDILSIDPNAPQGIQNPCVQDYPGGPYMDCSYEKYWEMGFFSTNEPNTKYFMMVNRRCIPELNGYHGDDRVLRIKFNLSGPVGWYISEVGSMSAPILFNRNYYVELGNTEGSMGWFEPGEAKMFKLQPMMVKGGTMIADEVISAGDFTCEAPVYNNGHNITIEAGTTIHFNDSSRFVMSGGTFTIGDQNTNGSQNITCDAVNGSSWLGHSFTNCEVRIFGTDFSGVVNDTAYTLNMVDCPVVDIRNCTFNSEQSVKGAVNAVYYNNQLSQIENVYIYGNTFNSSGSTIPTVNISSYAGLTLPLIIENNTFNYGNTAIFLSGVTGGAIKGNTITDNYYSINALTSSVDIAENNINSSIEGSIGVFSAGGSEVRLSKAGNLLIGGHNYITNTGTGSNNIRVDGAVFLLDDGENVFDIASNQSASHLNGWFPYFTAISYSEIHNCWKVDNSAVEPYVLITDGYQGSPISFTFTPYLTGCEVSTCEDYTVINLGDGIYDSVCTGAMGEGGSKKEIPLSRGVTAEGSRGVFVISTAKQKSDSISVLMRYRNYTQARIKCLDLINTYPDSIQALSAVSKLFLAVTATDTTINGAGELKTYYENLILNHPNNVSLVKRVNYFILKCKVKMRLYSQALAGFQQIINENPYSYEGLIARWDYMATSLLAPQGGAFNSDFGLEISDYDINDAEDNPQSEFRDPQSQDDKSPFTKEQRQDIRKSINSAIETGRNNDETRIKKLEEQVSLGDVNAANDLKKLRTLKEVVKTQKPANILQHVKIVSEDIRKVFGEGTSNSKTTPNNLPSVYRLSQNYPNPFNPTTKINYDLPRDAKVTIIIYDILGQEVKRLVNNELKKAGTYIVDFRAQNYASGVYFYRIEAEETNGFKFVDSKKMVLLK